MKKFIFFSLWNIADVESKLERLEESGYRLEKIRHSYWFYFKDSAPKKISYFLSYKSFRGKSMGHIDYALLSNHYANPIESDTCFYDMYRTKESKENLSLLYGARLDFIKSKLLERTLASLILSVLFLIPCLAAIIFQSSYKEISIFAPIIAVCLFLTAYYLYGYIKQKNKCKEYQKDFDK